MRVFFDKVFNINLEPEIRQKDILYTYEGIYEIYNNKIYKQKMIYDSEPITYELSNSSYIEDNSRYGLEMVNKIPFSYHKETQTIYTYIISDHIKYIKIYNKDNTLVDHYFYSQNKFNYEDLSSLFNSYYSK